MEPGFHGPEAESEDTCSSDIWEILRERGQTQIAIESHRTYMDEALESRFNFNHGSPFSLYP
jgi:hypothetical protein